MVYIGIDYYHKLDLRRREYILHHLKGYKVGKLQNLHNIYRSGFRCILDFLYILDMK